MTIFNFRKNEFEEAARLSLLVFLLVPFISMAQYNRVVFFAHAHQDDAVYFSGVPMSDYVADNNSKTVFILYSASDQGAHTGVYTPDAKRGNTYPFYKARDYGLMRAIEFCSTNGNLPSDFAEEPHSLTINEKTIRKWTYRNSVVYFFDLPNGECCSLNMKGYPANNYETIEKLRKGIIPKINSMNGQSYTWEELVQVTKTIFENEAQNVSNVEVYSTDVDFSKNPNDHADHYVTSVLALEAMSEMSNFKSKLHIDYHLSNLPANVSHNNIVKKTATFGAMVSGLASKGYKAGRHLDWFDKEYIREANVKSELENLNPSLRKPVSDLENPNMELSPDRLFSIKNVNSKLLLSVDNQGRVVQQIPDENNPNQKWYVLEQKNNSFALLNVGTDKLVESTELPKNGDKLRNSLFNGVLTKEQQFFIMSAGGEDFKYILSAVNPVLHFELYSSNQKDGFEINLWNSNGGYNNQKWIFEEIINTQEGVFESVAGRSSLSEELILYPNPVEDKLTLSFQNSNTLEGYYQVNLMNLSGISYFKGAGTLSEINQRINSIVRDLPAGVFMVQLYSKTKKHYVRFIKQ